MFSIMLAAIESTAIYAIAAAFAIGLVAFGCAFAMGKVITKTVESIARQPEADNKIRSAMILGLVFIETIAIYALVIAILLAIKVLG